jgi:hypothetical protein
MLAGSGEAARPIGMTDEELEVAEQAGGRCMTGRMGARTGKKRRKTTLAGVETGTSRFRIFGVE